MGKPKKYEYKDRIPDIHWRRRPVRKKNKYPILNKPASKNQHEAITCPNCGEDMKQRPKGTWTCVECEYKEVR